MTSSKPSAKKVMDRLDPDSYRWTARILPMIVLGLAITTIPVTNQSNNHWIIILTVGALGFPAFVAGSKTVQSLSKIRIVRNHPMHNLYLLTRAVLIVSTTSSFYAIFAKICLDNHLSKFYDIPVSAYSIMLFAGSTFVVGVAFGLFIVLFRVMDYSRDEDCVSFRKLPVGAMFSLNGYHDAIILQKVSPMEFSSATYPDLGPTRIDNSFGMVYPQSNEQADTPTVKT